jgi:hypothetical protein
MTRLSQALTVYDPRLLNPPPAFIFLELLHDIIGIEKILPLVTDPGHVDMIVSELRCMFATMQHLLDWSLFRRVTCLLSRARVISRRLSYERVQRCAALVDLCRMHQHTLLCRSGYFPDCIYCRHTAVDLLTDPPNYDDMALAVSACDDMLPYLRPLCKSFYLYDLRPCLVAFMADSESEPESSDSEDVGCVRVGLPAGKRARQCVPQ